MHMAFSGQPFYKLLTCIFSLHLEMLQYPALHDLINITENSDTIFACDTMENEEKYKLFITFFLKKKHILSYHLHLKKTDKN